MIFSLGRCKPFQVSPEAIAKKGLLPVIEINLDLVGNEVRFQPQVCNQPRKVGIHFNSLDMQKHGKIFSRII